MSSLSDPPFHTRAHPAPPQLRMAPHYEHVLPTLVAASAAEALQWAELRWGTATATAAAAAAAGTTGAGAGEGGKEGSGSGSGSGTGVGGNREIDGDWWVLKASGGNGGKDVWVVNRSNYRQVIEERMPRARSNGSAAVASAAAVNKGAGAGAGAGAAEELVIQKYVSQPLLYQGKKFHFRCYSLLHADMSAMVYQMAYILTAGHAYKPETGKEGAGQGDLDVHQVRAPSAFAVSRVHYILHSALYGPLLTSLPLARS